MEKSWMTKSRQSWEYKAVVTAFLDFAYSNSSWEGRIYYHCTSCNNCLLLGSSIVKLHLEKFRILPIYTIWVDHEEEYKNVMSNRRNTISQEEMENMVNDGFRCKQG